MKDKVFIDTNVLVYYFQKKDEPKKIIARRLINDYIDNIVISTQILGELFNVLKKSGNTSKKSTEIIKECLVSFEVISIEPYIVSQALYIHERYEYSYYDSQVIFAALYSYCKILYTEDLHHNQLIEKKLRIINPFK
ncbi:MAG: hypothetical protein B6D61_13085 [Bacteroidetes bacterium 4484_249]|nr:MAG: hypothetical protein B6D61_13085 [Bacteroidetes bacterium 4484_249]